MNARAGDALELIFVEADAPRRTTPLLFLHGAHAGAWCWAEHFMPWFAARGWDTYAVSLLGHGESPGADYLDALSIDNYVDDLHKTIASLPRTPVVIGHSMGGFVLQKYLEHTRLPGAALLCSVPPGGLAGAALGLAMQRPGLLVDLGRLAGGTAVGSRDLVEAMFHKPIPEALIARYFGLMRGESQRAIWDMLGFNLPRIRQEHCGHMFVLGTREDRLIPQSAIHQTAIAWNVQPVLVDDIGHGFMLEPGWETVAQALTDWIEARFD